MPEQLINIRATMAQTEARLQGVESCELAFDDDFRSLVPRCSVRLGARFARGQTPRKTPILPMINTAGIRFRHYHRHG